MKTGPGSEWLFRLLLRCYPKRFRVRFGHDLIEAFRDQRAEPRYAGSMGALRFWRDIGWDWVRAMVQARRTKGRQRDGTTGAGAVTRRHDDDGYSLGWEGIVEGFRQDIGFAVRSFLRAPGFTAVAVLTLAIGIGSTAAMFGVVNSVLLKPLPYDEPEEVVTIWSSWVGFPRTWVSEHEYRTYLTQTRGFEDIALWNETSVSFTDPTSPERVDAVNTTENLVDVLGVDMQLGRFFTRDEALRTDSLPADVIVISHEAWVRRWNADPGVIGRMAEVNGRNREVIGVLPAGFRLPTQFATTEVANVYFARNVPREPVTDYRENGGSHGDYVVGRLAAGYTVEAAAGEIDAALDRVNAEFAAYPPERRFRALVFSAQDDVFGSIRPALVALLATVAFVLLIACANVASLLLARSDDRADELAVRAALGAGRGRLISQMLVESLVLACMGGVAGLMLAVGAVELFKGLNPGNLPRIDQVRLDGVVLGFAALVTLGTAVLFGILPALRVTAGGLASRMGRRSERGVGRSGWQGTLVAAEMALAVVLVVGAGLMVRTFDALTSIDPGFDGERTLTAAVSLPTTRYPDPAAAVQFFNEAIRQVGELPGVESVGAIRQLPLASQIGDWGLDIEGYDESVNPSASGDWQIASPGYFATMGIAMTAGRDFSWTDDAEAAPVGIVNEALVRRYWPNVEPLGRTFVMSGTTVTVVGVARDVRHNGLVDEIKPKFYIPHAQWGLVTRGIPTSMRLVVRTSGDPLSLAQPVREVIRGLDPSLAVAEVRTVRDVLGGAVAQPRFLVVLMASFSAIALLLAMIGIYGVIAYGVANRTQEIGVRMALGAVQDQVVGLMVRRGASMIAIGLIAGLGLALTLSRFLESQLYGVTATDPATFASVVAGFAAVAALATWIPSRRAARIDPIRALKTD